MNRRTLFGYGIALDVAVIATGIALLLPPGDFLLFAPYLAGIVIAAWFTGAEVGLVATAFSVVALVLQFPEQLDTQRLTLFAAGGATLSLGANAARAIVSRRWTVVRPAEEPVAWTVAGPLAIGLPILIVIIYTNLSDVAMRAAGTPSLLQPLIVLLGFAVWKLRHVARPVDVATQPLAIFLAGYCFVLFVSSNWASDVYAADENIIEAVKSLAIFVIAASLAASWRALRAAVMALAFAAAFLASLTVIQKVTGTMYDFFGLATFDQGNIYGNVSEPRASGPVGDPNFYAQLLLIVVPLAALLAYTERRKSLRLVYAGVTLTIIAGVLLTYSRGAMLALGTMALTAAIAMKVKVRHLAAAGMAGLMLLAVLPDNVTKRFATIEELMPGREDQAAEPDAAIEKRKLLLATAWTMFDDHLFFGVGTGNFGRHHDEYVSRIGSSAPQYEPPGQRELPHTLYLEIASETGLLGLSLFGAAIAAAAISLNRSRKQLLARGDGHHATIAMSLGLALFGYLFTSIFLHGAYQRNLWILFALVAATAKLSATQISNEEVPA
ncbi:MAG TPA: O-antigen ligase family protein [Thermoanaerobaculia bacterium]|jgi:O-antigen ligase